VKWNRRIRLERDGIDLAAEINAAVAVNRGTPGQTTKVDSQTTKVDSASRVSAARRSRRAPGDAEAPQTDPKEHR
jgi:hypothetical protein